MLRLAYQHKWREWEKEATELKNPSKTNALIVICNLFYIHLIPKAQEHHASISILITENSVLAKSIFSSNIAEKYGSLNALI